MTTSHWHSLSTALNIYVIDGLRRGFRGPPVKGSQLDVGWYPPKVLQMVLLLELGPVHQSLGTRHGKRAPDSQRAMGGVGHLLGTNFDRQGRRVGNCISPFPDLENRAGCDGVAKSEVGRTPKRGGIWSDARTLPVFQLECNVLVTTQTPRSIHDSDGFVYLGLPHQEYGLLARVKSSNHDRPQMFASDLVFDAIGRTDASNISASLLWAAGMETCTSNYCTEAQCFMFESKLDMLRPGVNQYIHQLRGKL
ncbi:hypothetical protein C8R43DRAFT_1193424 [Mycena crocata]|nr:hypothetical protein C8R43DRAFT_1193424 [Mycena crocata]